VEAGLADGCLYPDEVERALEALMPEPPGDRPGPRRVRLVEATLYHAIRVGDTGWRPLFNGLPRIAYVVARGAIGSGRGHRGIASDGYRELFEVIRRDERVRGVVLRIDSGGGDAVASDLLCRSVSLVTEEKPVVVSMGDVVASGGYYMASAADEVLAEAGTVTGSIGVVGGKVNLEGLYRRIGVAKEAIERGARAGLLSESRGFTPDERSAVRGEMAALYETFVGRVARGRGLSVDDTREMAEGRVWSGSRARQIGLVDAIGGPLEALLAARRRAGLRRDEPVVIDRHPRLPPIPGLRDLRRWIPRF
jgi:protease-4